MGNIKTNRIIFKLLLSINLLCSSTVSLDHTFDENSKDVNSSNAMKKKNVDFKILEAPVKIDDGPKIAWLMTFPGAGTTYTTFLVKQASNTTSATNYGNEYLNENKESVPLYSDISGPYLWQDENIQGLNVPSTYILTKTHCGGRCQDCPPRSYIEDVDSFMLQCLRAPKVISIDKELSSTMDSNKRIVRRIAVAKGVFQSLVLDSYDTSIVKKMVHVIKNPYDNVISRFHHEYKSLGLVQSNQKAKVVFGYKHNNEGFQEWCKKQDKKFINAEQEMYGHYYALTKNVPCHAEFYRYVQWHNLAFELADKLNIKSYVFNYEDFKSKQEEIITEILDYLELPIVDNALSNLMPFRLDNFRDHYSNKQMDAVAIYIRSLSSEKTWSYVCRYFPDRSLAHAYNFLPSSSSKDEFCSSKRLTREFYDVVANISD